MPSYERGGRVAHIVLDEKYVGADRRRFKKFVRYEPVAYATHIYFFKIYVGYPNYSLSVDPNRVIDLFIPHSTELHKGGRGRALRGWESSRCHRSGLARL